MTNWREELRNKFGTDNGEEVYLYGLETIVNLESFIEQLLEKQKEEIKHYVFEMNNNCKSKTYKLMFSKLLLKIEMLSNNPRIEG